MCYIFCFYISPLLFIYMTIIRHFGYPTFSIPETRVPDLQLPEPEPDIFEVPEPEPDIFEEPEPKPEIFQKSWKLGLNA